METRTNDETSMLTSPLTNEQALEGCGRGWICLMGETPSCRCRCQRSRHGLLQDSPRGRAMREDWRASLQPGGNRHGILRKLLGIPAGPGRVRHRVA